MSNVVPASDPLTSSEVALVANLAALPVSGTGQAIQKTGATTFANISVGTGTGAYFGTQEKSTVAPNGAIVIFPFAHAVGTIVYNGAVQIHTGISAFDDITVSGNSITFLNGVVPIPSDKIINIYQ